jgi:hypothetical protein
MSAKKTGGTAGRQRAKDAAMAAMLKAQGVERHTARCPLCHNLVAIRNLPHHIATCKAS